MPSWVTRLVLLLAGAAGAASATPPQIVSVRDMLYARDAGTLPILRAITDNHGRHGVMQTVTLLVFRSLTDGADHGFQVVERRIEE